MKDEGKNNAYLDEHVLVEALVGQLLGLPLGCVIKCAADLANTEAE